MISHELHAFSKLVDEKCYRMGEASAYSFLLRIIALTFAISFVGFEALYRCGDVVAQLNTFLLILTIVGFCSFALAVCLFVAYVVGLSVRPPRSKVHSSSW
jgi:hypothetical protein